MAPAMSSVVQHSTIAEQSARIPRATRTDGIRPRSAGVSMLPCARVMDEI
jgi:hypothetical protein